MRLCLAVALLAIPATAARAGLVTYQFTGTVTQGSSPLLHIQTGDSLVGTFTLDTSVPNTSTSPGQGFYLQNEALVLRFSGVTLRADQFVSVVTDNGPPGFDTDQFHVGAADFVAAGGPPLSHGEVVNSFDLIDSTATVFSSVALPTSLDLSRFDHQRGLLVVRNGIVPESLVHYSIDTIENISSAVPEPGGLELVAAAAAGLTLRAWRKRRRGRATGDGPFVSLAPLTPSTPPPAPSAMPRSPSGPQPRP